MAVLETESLRVQSDSGSPKRPTLPYVGQISIVAGSGLPGTSCCGQAEI